MMETGNTCAVRHGWGVYQAETPISRSCTARKTEVTIILPYLQKP